MIEPHVLIWTVWGLTIIFNAGALIDRFHSGRKTSTGTYVGSIVAAPFFSLAITFGWLDSD